MARVKHKHTIPDYVKKLSKAKLSLYRTKIYKKKFPGKSPFFRPKGKPITPAGGVRIRGINFNKFVDMYFHEIIPGSATKGSFTYKDASGFEKSSQAYIAFKRYSKTDYGSAVIKEMIKNPKKYEGFTILRSTTGNAKGVKTLLALPKIFPARPTFKVGGQKIFDLAIIHHEFWHTIVFGFIKYKTTIKDERLTVINAENPVRIRYGGGKYEPRYTYYNDKKEKDKPIGTINIITGEVKPRKWTVNKYDPRILVRLTDPEALK